MDILDYMLLPCIYVLRTAFTFIPLVIPMIFYLFFSSMFTFIAFEDYVIRRILLTVIKLLYYSSTYTLRLAQTTWLAFSFWPRFYWHLFGPSSKGRSMSDILFHTYTPPLSRQNENLWKIHTDKHLTCHRYDLLISTGIQVRGTNQHHAQPLNQQFVSAYNAATSYTLINDPFRLAASELARPHPIRFDLATGLYSHSITCGHINHHYFSIDNHNSGISILPQ